MENDELEKFYQDLFDEKSKIEAFDKIAKNYYCCNFGSMQKSDLDVLMFSILIDRILEKTEEDFNTYSDYTLSKKLGITQQRISNLKIKKELKYPYEKFDWRKSFARLVKNARFEDEKIKIYIPDPNLFLEIKNSIESNGGYIDVTLNSKLLQITPEYYLWLLMIIVPENEKESLNKAIQTQLKKNQVDVNDFGPVTFSKLLKEKGLGLAVNTIGSVLEKCVPVAGPVMKTFLEIGAELLTEK